jgi:hypothetical protein
MLMIVTFINKLQYMIAVLVVCRVDNSANSDHDDIDNDEQSLLIAIFDVGAPRKTDLHLLQQVRCTGSVCHTE